MLGSHFFLLDSFRFWGGGVRESEGGGGGGERVLMETLDCVWPILRRHTTSNSVDFTSFRSLQGAGCVVGMEQEWY